MADWTDVDLEDALRRAFVDRRADYIFLDDRRQAFRIESVRLGVERGWLTEEFVEIDEQYAQLRYRLTEEGKRHFHG